MKTEADVRAFLAQRRATTPPQGPAAAEGDVRALIARRRAALQQAPTPPSTERLTDPSTQPSTPAPHARPRGGLRNTFAPPVLPEKPRPQYRRGPDPDAADYTEQLDAEVRPRILAGPRPVAPPDAARTPLPQRDRPDENRPAPRPLAGLPFATDPVQPHERDTRYATRSVVDEAHAGVTRGAGQLLESVGGAVEAARALNPAFTAGLPSGRGAIEAGRRIARDPRAAPSDAAAETLNLGSPRWWVSGLSQLAPQYLTQIGLGVATGGVAGVGLFALPTLVQEGGLAFTEAEEDFRAGGDDEETARAKAAGVAAVVGIGNAALEVIPGATLLLDIPGAGRAFQQSVVRRVLARGGANALAEGGTEIGQEAWADVVAYASNADPEAFTDWLRRYGAAGALGAVAGAGAGVAIGGGGQDDLVDEGRLEERRFLLDQRTDDAMRPPVASAEELRPEDRAEPETDFSISENATAPGPDQEPEPTPASERQSRLEEHFPVAEIAVDPERFQFKLDVDQEGVGRELKSVRTFDPDLGGVIQVWRDPADGRTYVINGHHRLELAKRTGTEAVAVRFIDAADAREARLTGARTNIAEGRGTAVDAAKLIRDEGLTPEQLEESGISLRGANARDGLALANLHPTLFQQVVRQELPLARAAVIGRSGLVEAQQLALVDMLAQQRREPTNAQLTELIRFVQGAGATESTQESLFGEETLRSSLALEKAKVSAEIKKRLASDRRLFSFLSKGERGERIEEQGVGRVDVERAAALKTDAEQLEEVYDRLSTLAGPISEALNEGARAVAEGRSVTDAVRDLHPRVVAAIEAELATLAGGRARAPDPARSEGAPARAGGVPQAAPPAARPAELDPDQQPLLSPDVQDDLFGGRPQVSGSLQSSLFTGPESQTLSDAERQARATVDRLRVLVERKAASPRQLEQYREALALLRRAEAQNAEEVRLRAEDEPDVDDDTGELFGAVGDPGRVYVLEPGTAEGRPGSEDRPDGSLGERPSERPAGGIRTSGPPAESASNLEQPDADDNPLADVEPASGTEPPTDPFLPEAALANIGNRIAGNLQTPTGQQPGKGVSAPQVIRAIGRVAEAAGRTIPMRVGRLRTRRARGLYFPKQEVIRINQANNIATAAHELGHALEKILYGWPHGGPWKKPLVTRTIQAELHALGRALYGSTQPAGGYKREGWAEFARIWITKTDVRGNAAEPSTLAPELTTWFEGAFSKSNPEVRKAFDATRTLARQWAEQGSLERARQSMVDPASPRERASRATEAVRSQLTMAKLVEMARPFEKAARYAEERLGRKLALEDDPFALISALRTTHAARTRVMVEDGMLDLAGNKVGPALQEIRALVEGRQFEFTVYLWARRALALGSSRPAGLSIEDAAQIIAELDSPKFQTAAGKVYDWNDGVLNYAAQASPTFREVVQRVRAKDPGNYVPLQRHFDELDRVWGSLPKGGATRNSPVQRLKGSGRRIKDLFQAMIAQAEQTVRKAHERAVLDALVRLAKVEGMGRWINEIKPDQVPAYTASIGKLLQEVEAALGAEGIQVDLKDQAGNAPRALDVANVLGETVTFFSDAKQAPTGEIIYPVWDKGRLRWFELDPELFGALRSLDVYRMPAAAELVLGRPAAAFRAGTTGLRASFGLIWNPLRDVQTLYVNTRSGANGARLFGEWMRAMGEMATARTVGKRTEWVDTFIRLGGEMAQPLGQDIPHTRRAARRLFGGRTMRTLDPRNWFDFYRDLVQFPEGAPRIAELRLVAEEIGWKPGQPMTLGQSLELLIATKQVTTDFTAAGELARAVNRMVPFHNSAIQGPRANIRAAQRNPARFAFRGAQLAAVTLLLWFRQKDEEWYKEMDYREKFLHWHFAIDWPESTLVRIPRSFEIGLVFSALPEAFMDAWYRQDPEAALAWFKIFAETASPNLMPVIPGEVLQQARNRDSYSKMPIETMGEEHKPAEERFNEYTSRASILLGRLFNASPKRIDHAVEGLLGPVAGDLLELLGLGPAGVDREKELADTPLVGRLFQRGGRLGARPRSIEQMYQELERAQKRQHSDREPETERQREQRLQLDDAAQAVSALLYVRRYTPDSQRRQQLTGEASRIAAAAVQAEETGRLTRERFADARLSAEEREGRLKARQRREVLAARRRRSLLGREDAEASSRPGRAPR